LFGTQPQCDIAIQTLVASGGCSEEVIEEVHSSRPRTSNDSHQIKLMERDRPLQFRKSNEDRIYGAECYETTMKSVGALIDGRSHVECQKLRAEIDLKTRTWRTCVQHEQLHVSEVFRR